MKEIDALESELELRYDQITSTTADLRESKKLLKKKSDMSQNRLERERSLKRKYDELRCNHIELLKSHDNIYNQLKEHQLKEEKNDSLQSKIQKDCPIGRKGGRSRWPPHIVQLICEQLVNGTPPSAILSNLVSMFAINEIILDDVPSVNFCRQCCTVVQVLVETLTIKRLAEAEFWDQVFFDGTSRRQVSFSNFIVGLKNSNNNLDTFTLSSCIFPEDETAEKQVEAMISTVSYCLVLRNVLTFISMSLNQYLFPLSLSA